MTAFKKFVLILFFFLTSTSARAGERLLFAVDIVRHGNRTPIAELPKSPYEWKEGLSTLTQLGVEQEYKLGQLLRKEYVEKYGLLPSQYHLGDLYVRSTETARTQASAKALLSGLYPAEVRGNQGIPIETVKISEDDLLLVHPSNNIFSVIKVYCLKRKFWKEKTKDIQNKLKSWHEVTGLGIKDFDELSILADNLSLRQLHGVPLPIGISQQDANEIISLDQWAMVTTFKLPEISEPTGRKLISSIQNYMNKSVQEKSPLKYVLYSGHDATIMSALATLGVAFEKVPDFASRLSFSLFKDGGDYIVKVSYNGQQLRIPACKRGSCTISEWNSF